MNEPNFANHNDKTDKQAYERDEQMRPSYTMEATLNGSQWNTLRCLVALIIVANVGVNENG